MSKRDYYAVLELHPTCTQLDIKQSFKRLALKWHPDKCFNKPDAQLRFSEINEAYTVLADARTKEIYDVHGHKGIELDQENGYQGVPQANFFFEKGFQGSQKSAFEVLQDILFQEKDDDDFFAKKDSFGVSDSIKATLLSFMDDSDMSNQADTGMNFFDTYKPTFMNPDFMMPPLDFDSGIADKSYTAHIFSYFAGSEEQMYASTSTTVIQNGKSETTTQDMYIDQSGLFRNVENLESKDKRKNQYGNDNKPYEQYYTQASREPSLMVISDDSDDMISQTSNKDIRLTNKKSSDEIIDELNAQLLDSVSLKSKKISKDKDSLNIRLMNKKPSKKNRA